MKMLNKVMAAALLSSALIGSAIASDAHYGLPTASTTANHKSPAYESHVVLRNYTNDDYTAYANFHYRSPINMYVGAYGSGEDVITYDLVNDEVCLRIVRNFDGAQIFNQCMDSGEVDIGPYMSAHKPSVKVIR